jgi:uncharacterized protein
MPMGQFFWFDLMTPDTEGAKRFYGEITGWKTSQFPSGDYEVWENKGKGLGGVMKPPMAGMPPHWMGYVLVDDVDAMLERAQRKGAKVVAKPTDIPNTGRFAVLTDPQGATFALFKPTTAGGKDAPSIRQEPGWFAWAELNTTDAKAAWSFYSELFGWKSTESMSMGPELGDYMMFSTGGKESFGGMSNAAKMMKAPPHWLYYISVKNVEQTLKTVTAKGGKILNGPMDVPGGRIAQCLDPQGAAFAIHARN